MIKTKETSQRLEIFTKLLSNSPNIIYLHRNYGNLKLLYETYIFTNWIKTNIVMRSTKLIRPTPRLPKKCLRSLTRMSHLSYISTKVK